MCKGRPPHIAMWVSLLILGKIQSPLKQLRTFPLSSVEFSWAQQVKDSLTEVKDSLEKLYNLDSDKQKKGIVKFFHKLQG